MNPIIYRPNHDGTWREIELLFHIALNASRVLRCSIPDADVPAQGKAEWRRQVEMQARLQEEI